ncbi:hypothetical protein DFQ30_005180 [Apophysomyces sp. BC1015]|nr:hypothetical protein DFQ30_005180 [Apophysomyces sp. BC1015]
MKTRLKEFKQHMVRNANEEENYACSSLVFGSMLKEINYHIDYLETIQFKPVHKERMLANFTKFKMELLEYQKQYGFQLQKKTLEKMTAKFKQMREKSKKTAHKLKKKTKKNKELEAKIKSLEEHGTENQGSEQQISLSSSLVIKLHLVGSPEMVRCISFDDGYTSYGQLHEKIRDVFHIGSNSFTLKYSDSKGEFNNIFTSEDYREAVKVAFVNQLFDVPISVIKVHVEPGIESIDSETKSSSEDESSKGSVSEQEDTEDNKSHSDTSVTDSSLVRIQSDVRWDRPEDAERESIVLRVLPRNDYEELDFGVYHWTIWNWSFQEEALSSKTFVVGGYKWSIKIHPKGDSKEAGNSISIYLELADNVPEQIDVYVENVFMISNPNDATNYYDKTMDYDVYGKHKSLGYSDFYPFENLDKLHKGKGPFVVNNRIVVSACVRVVKDPNMNN